MNEAMPSQELARLRNLEPRGTDYTVAGYKSLLAEVDRLAEALAELEELGIERHAEMLVDEVRLRSLEIRNGGFKMEMEEARDLAAIYVACARTMLGNAENYTETPIEFHVKVAEQPELFILTVQRTEPHKLTPHQARREAEAERDRLAARVRELEADRVDFEWSFTEEGEPNLKTTGVLRETAEELIASYSAAHPGSRWVLYRRSVGPWQPADGAES